MIETRNPGFLRCVIVAAMFLCTLANAEVRGEPDLLFQSNAALNVSFSGPFTTLIEERPKDDYLPGVIRYEDPNGTEVALDVEIRARGHFRHQACDYPPVLLNFKNAQTKGTLFKKQKKLKLVIPCKYSGQYEQIILREYLAYRILNAVTDMSFRVRLLRVTFGNTEKNRKNPEVRYAFLIEHKNRLAERYDMKDLKIERTSVAAIVPDRLNLTSIFNFLIGNTDFSPIAGPPDSKCCHNYVLFRDKKKDPIIAVPYDFDQSGFVDAPYATPAEPFKLRSVRQRLYRGRCVNNEYLDSSLQRFKDRRGQIFDLINEQEGLSPSTRKKLISYVGQFYRLIDKPSDVDRYIIGKCV